VRVEFAVVESPVGRVAVAWQEDRVVCAQMDIAVSRGTWETEWVEGDVESHLRAALVRRYGADIEIVGPVRDAAPADALRRFFDGDPAALDTLDVDPGGTEFQRVIWRELRRIAPGRTRTYGELATAAGRPGAARAAGGAVGANPIPLVIPCHRIIGTDGRLTGFGGGISRKRWLLRHEGAGFRDDAPVQLSLV